MVISMDKLRFFCLFFMKGDNNFELTVTVEHHLCPVYPQVNKKQSKCQKSKAFHRKIHRNKCIVCIVTYNLVKLRFYRNVL